MEQPNMPMQPQVQVVAPDQEEDSFNLSDFIALCLSKWGWFVTSFICFMVLGGLYLLMTPKNYTRSAELIIKDNQSGGSPVSDMMSNIGLFNSSPDVNNEVIAFKSPELFSETILRLGDNVVYQTRKFLRPELLYGDSLPIKVDFVGMPVTRNATLKVRILGKGQIELFKFRDNKGKVIKSENIIANLGDTVSTPLGPVAVLPGPDFDPAFDSDITVKHLSIASAIQLFSKKVTVEIVDENATVIGISMVDVSIARADDFINTLIDEYNKKWIEDKNQLAALTSRFITERLNVIESELGNVDSDISQYKSEHLLPDIQAASEMYMRRADDNLRNQLEITTQLSIAKYLCDFANETIEKGGLLPANSGLTSSGIEKQIEEYNSIQLMRDGLLANSSASNPIVQDYDNRLRSMRAAIIASLNNLTVTLNTQLKSLQKADRTTNEAIASSPSQAKYLLTVERQQKVKEALYLFLLQKREENELTRSFTADNTRILFYATGNPKPTGPKALTILVICLFLAVAIPVVFLYLSETFNTRIRTREDLRNMVTPFIGELPHYNVKKYFSLKERFRRMWSRMTGHTYRENTVPEMVIKERSQNAINEAFRILRANLEFMSPGQGHKIVMLTSYNPGSGKSFITLNIAATMALKHTNARVLAIDLDLRRASLSAAAGKAQQGISSYLSGAIDDYRSLIIQSNCKNLDILPVGAVPPNPTELLYSDRLGKMLESLREDYDYIFIDCPPAEIVADASIITKFSDVTLFVIRTGLLDKRLLVSIDQLYKSKRYNNLGVILNGSFHGSNPYRRYGRYGHYNGYYRED